MTTRWAILESVEVRCRIHINCTLPKFAHFDARLGPSSGHHGILVEEKWESMDDAKWLSAVEAGVELFVTRRLGEGRPVCDSTFTILRVIAHPIVTDEATVTRNVATTLSFEFERYAVPVE